MQSLIFGNHVIKFCDSNFIMILMKIFPINILQFAELYSTGDNHLNNVKIHQVYITFLGLILHFFYKTTDEHEKMNNTNPRHLM